MSKPQQINRFRPASHWSVHENFVFCMEMDKFASLVEKSDPFSTWWPFIIAFIVGLSMTIRTLMGGQRCPTSNLIDKQVVIVTGGSSGIGMELCKALCARSARVIMTCRDMEKADKFVGIITREIECTAGTECHLQARYLDLRSFDSVRRFAKGIIKDFERVDILINNAGIIFHPNEKTVDGFEIHLQVNYLSPCLLTHLLLPHLRKSKNGRIINVSAHAHVSGRLSSDIEDPLNVGTWATIFHPREAFAHSKLVLIMFTKHLAKLLKGTDVTVNVYTPGLVRGTGHLRRSPLMSALCVKVITYPWMWLFMKSPFEGAQCGIYLATDPKLKKVSGEYFNDCEIVTPSEVAKDEHLSEKLFTETVKCLKIENFL